MIYHGRAHDVLASITLGEMWAKYMEWYEHELEKIDLHQHPADILLARASLEGILRHARALAVVHTRWCERSALYGRMFITAEQVAAFKAQESQTP